MPETPSTDESQSKFTVVSNDEEQYSIWPLGCAIPPGWRKVQDGGADATGSKADCLERVGKLWTDMRPRSLRKDSPQPL